MVAAIAALGLRLRPKIAAQSRFAAASGRPMASQVAQEEVAVAATAVGASLASLLGVLFVLCSWACGAGPRVYYLKLVMLLAVANGITAVGYGLSLRRLLPPGASTRPDLGGSGSGRFGATADAPGIHVDGESSGTEDALCGFQAWLVTAGELSSLLWTLAIALALDSQVVRKSVDTGRTERLAHAVCWGVPAAAASLMLVSQSLGPPTPAHREWCWIRGGPYPPRVALELLTFDLPVVACLAACLACYARIARAFRTLGREGAVDTAGQAALHARLRAYVLVFLVGWLPALVHRAWRLAAAAGARPSAGNATAEGGGGGGWGGGGGGWSGGAGGGGGWGGSSGGSFTVDGSDFTVDGADLGDLAAPFGLRLAHAATAPLVRALKVALPPPP